MLNNAATDAEGYLLSLSIYISLQKESASFLFSGNYF